MEENFNVQLDNAMPRRIPFSPSHFRADTENT